MSITWRVNFKLHLKDRDEVDVAVAMVSKMKVSGKQQKYIKGKNLKKAEVGLIKCFSCGKAGHVSKNCRTGIICFKCHTKGHKSSECTCEKQNFAMMTRSEVDLINKSHYSECDIWLVESCASHHVTNRRDWFVTYTPFGTPQKMDDIQTLGSGKIDVMVFDVIQ
uniref:CCHC-type domain-containing protein n=1 Tax=Cuerna arida TaxID=1464854 RepID=A0A1B6F976_9HEMI